MIKIRTVIIAHEFNNRKGRIVLDAFQDMFLESMEFLLYHHFGWNIKRLMRLLVLHWGQMRQSMFEACLRRAKSESVRWGEAIQYQCVSCLPLMVLVMVEYEARESDC